MYKEQIFLSDSELPSHLKWQILSCMRFNFPDGFQGPNETRDWLNNPADKSIHVVITTENDILVSYCAVVRKQIVHLNEEYSIMGLTGVMATLPFKGRGFGTKVIDIGTKIIRESLVDVGMFHCSHDLKGFYVKSGWEPMEKTITLVGNPEHPETSDELMMALFFSEKAKLHKPDFESTPVYFGKDTW